MQTDNPDFDKQALIDLLQTAYALDVARLEFVPKGEESHSYSATTKTERTYFVKVHTASVSPSLTACYRFVHHLYTQGNYGQDNCKWVVAPHLTTTGECVTSLGNRAVAVFDYVSGVTKTHHELTPPQLAQCAAQLATLHRAVTPALEVGIPQETFEISFRAWLLEVLDAIEQPLNVHHAWAQAAYELLRANKPHILSLLAEVEASGAFLQAADISLSVTHGDLASQNIIQDAQGKLLIIDWGKLLLAPAARDLVDLWDDGNAALLAAYFGEIGMSPSLLSQTLAYYFHYNLLATITDYGSWLLLEEASAAEAASAWARLAKALPLDLVQVQSAVSKICSIMATTSGKNSSHAQPPSS